MDLTTVVLWLVGGAFLAFIWRDDLDVRRILTLVKWLGKAVLGLLIVILWFVTLPWSLFAILGLMVGQEADRKKANEAPHSHGDTWHTHPHDGWHRHPYGDDRFIYIEKEH